MSVPKLIQSLFPTARITSTKRSPSSALGRANPRSYHNIGQAVDIAPIPGIRFKDYVKSLENAGVNIVEALEEVGSNRSPWATGDHWHIAYATDNVPKIASKKPSPPVSAAPKEGPVEEPKMAMAEPQSEAAPFDLAGAEQDAMISLLAGLGKKKKKPKAMGILSTII